MSLNRNGGGSSSGSISSFADATADDVLYGRKNNTWVAAASVAQLAVLQAEVDADEAGLAAHLADTADAHDASAISFVPAGTIAAATVQLALEELSSEKAALSGAIFTGAVDFTHASHVEFTQDSYGTQFSAGTREYDLTPLHIWNAGAGVTDYRWYFNGTLKMTLTDAGNLTLAGGTHTFNGYTAFYGPAANFCQALIPNATGYGLVVYNSALTEYMTVAGGATSTINASAILALATAGTNRITISAAGVANFSAVPTVAGAAFPASGVGIADAGGYWMASDVEGVLQEIGAGVSVAAHLADGTDAHDASAISNTATGNIATTDVQASLGFVDAAAQPFRNRIINGDMRINQRNGASAVTGTGSGPFSCDRWRTYEDTDGTATGVRSTSTPPTGFSHFLRFSVTSADAALAAGQFAGVQQAIEGTNVVDLAFGTASAKAITISFWVRSSVTGTYSVAIRNSAGNRSYPVTYSISAANTWELKTITLAGDTSGTWATDTDPGIKLFFCLGTGTTYAGTSGAWAASSLLGATGTTNLMATNGATWDLTGVQVEAGSVATPFERRPFSTELTLCQRYYEKSYGTDYLPGTSTSVDSIITMRYRDSSTDYLTVAYKVPKRIAVNPSMYSSTGASGAIRNLSGAADVATAHSNAGENYATESFTAAASSVYGYHYTADADI